MGYLVDMSEFQPSNSVDWNTFSKNVDVLFFRIQYGSSHPDREYKNHTANAKKFNIPFHSYVFPHFISVADARVEADDAFTRHDASTLSIGIDIEPEYDTQGNPYGITKLPYQVRLDGIKVYVDELRQKGIKTIGAYIDQRVYEAWGINTILNLFDYIWIPAYGVDNGQVSLKPKYPCDLHQFTSKGKVDGYNGYLDLNQILNKGLDYFTGNQVLVQAKTDSVPPSSAPAPVNVKPVMIVKALGLCDIRSLPDHSSGFIRNTYDGEILNVWEIQGDWHRVAAIPEQNIFGWIDGNNGKNLFWLDNPAIQAQAAPQFNSYKIQPGDTLSKIATKFNTTVSTLKQINGYKNETIYAGSAMKVPAN